MKIEELRNIVKKYKKDQIEYVIAELYKMIPKSKKEENDLDAVLMNPEKYMNNKSEVKKKTQIKNIDEIANETNTFIENARGNCYLIPNRVVSKKDRPKWRFIVKQLYKDISALAEHPEHAAKCAELMENLYKLLTYSCGYTVFTAYDTFESVGIAQTDFFRKVIELNKRVLETDHYIEKAIRLIVENFVNRYTLTSELMMIFIETLPTPDLKNNTIQQTEKLWKTINDTLPLKKSNSYGFDRGEYAKKEKLNNITEIGFRCYAGLHEFKNAVELLKNKYIEKEKEILLYILIRLLFHYKQKELLLEQFDWAQKNKIQPRKSLLELKDTILMSGQLPQRF